MPTTLKRANVKVKVNGQFQDLGLLQSDVATQLADEITARQSKDNNLEANKIPYPQNPDSKYGNPGDILRTDGAGHTKWVPVGQPTDEQAQDAINNWLDEHPEATTTVEDHSLTYEKLVNGTLGFVTPEMFGAKGDGFTDDSIPFQNAINSGKPLYLQNKYLIHDIELIDNTTIDGEGYVIQDDSSHLFSCVSKSNILIKDIKIITKQNTFDTKYDGAIKFDSSSHIFVKNIVITSYTDRNFLFLNCENINVDGFTANKSGTIFTFTNCSNCECGNGIIYGDHNISAHGIDFYAANQIKCYNCVCHDIIGYDLTSGLLQYTANQINDNISSFVDYLFYNITAYRCSTVAKLDGLEECIFDRCSAISCNGGISIGGQSTARKILKTIIKNCYFDSTASSLYLCTYAVDSPELIGDVYYDSNIIEDCLVIFSNSISGTLIIKNNRIYSKTLTGTLSFSKSGANPENVIFENNYIEGSYTNIAFPGNSNNILKITNNNIIMKDGDSSGVRLILRCKKIIQFIGNTFEMKAYPNTFRINFPSNYTPESTESVEIFYGNNELILPTSISVMTLYAQGGAEHYKATSIDTTTITA